MKNPFLILLIVCCLVACKKEEKKAKPSYITVEENITETLPTITKEDINSAVIYEANIRQYSPSGHFDEFTKDIPQLKELGVKIIWLMPVFPISETKRKATGGANSKFATDFPENEQKKYLGSYYAVTDFTKINPEFGSIEDFRNLIKTAHDNDMFVILDWVPNHTGWDHIWINNNPDYYTKGTDGKITHPEGTDWTDVADLNYDNADMRKEMIEDMQYWLKDEGVDGFRCDVAGSVPVDFWEEAIPQLRKTKTVFMLAEAWEPALLKDGLFDMAYAWEGHHVLNSIAQGKMNVTDFYNYMNKMSKDYEANDILMNFITNHDENSWNGSIKERMGTAAPALLALEYMMPGMPLIYSGMEYDLDHRLKFFEKDSIPKTKATMWPLLEKLGTLKSTNPVLSENTVGANFTRIETDHRDVMMFSREQNASKLMYVANLAKWQRSFMPSVKGNFINYLTNETVSFTDQPIVLRPWEFMILVSK